jgi:hypothetical protein
MSIPFIVLTVTIVLCMGFIIGTILMMGEWRDDGSGTFAICSMGIIYTIADAMMLYTQ